MSGNSPLKNAARVTPVLLALMLAGILFFYKEAMLFSDCSHNIFRVVNHGHMAIEASRYGIFVSQAFPLIAAKLHLPLNVVMMSYAGSFYLFYLVVALLLVYKYRNYEFAILLGLYVTLLVSDSFYYLNNEGIAWLLLVFGLNLFIAAKKRHPALIYIVFIPTVYLALWTHPLVMMAGIYLWFFLMADKTTWPYTKVQSYTLTVILLLLSFWKFYEGMNHGYDSTKIEVITGFQPERLLTIYKAPQFHYLLRSFGQNYWLFSIIFILGIAELLKAKKYWLTLLTLVFAGGYFALLCITFWDTESRRFYMEIEYMPLAIITSVPFVYFVLPRLKTKLSVGILVFVYLVRLAYMHQAVKPFSERLALLEKMNTQMRNKGLSKVIITDPPNEANTTLIMNWGAPVESMLLSGLKGERPQRTFIFMNADEIKVNANVANNTMIGCWEYWTPEKMDSYYFAADTTTPYKIMTFSKLME